MSTRTYTPRRYWTQEERAFLVETHATLTAVEQAQALGRDYDVTCWQRQQLIRAGLITPHTRKYARIYTPDDDARIVELVQEGRSLRAISRELKRSYPSLYTHITQDLGGLKTLRGEPTSRVWSPLELANLFGLSRKTIQKWIQRGWIEVKRNKVGKLKHHKAPALITDEALQRFLERREHWPAWSPHTITDPDWKEHALEVRCNAGGEWVSMVAIARQCGIRLTRLYAWWRAGKLAELTTLVYGHEYFIWSTDVPKLPEIAAHLDGRHNRTRDERGCYV